MTNAEAIHDLEALKEFFEEQSNASPICLEYAINKLGQIKPERVNHSDEENMDDIMELAERIYNVDIYEAQNNDETPETLAKTIREMPEGIIRFLLDRIEDLEA